MLGKIGAKFGNNSLQEHFRMLARKTNYYESY